METTSMAGGENYQSLVGMNERLGTRLGAVLTKLGS